MLGPESRHQTEIIRTMVASGDPDFLKEVRLHLEDTFPFQLVSEVNEGGECLRRVRALEPDVLLIADDIQDIPPLQLSRRVNLTMPSITTIMLTGRDSVEYRDRAAAAGAWGVVPIPVAGERLRSSISQAYEFLKARVEEPPRRGLRGQGQIITFYSPKGGVGKSTLASSLAALVSRSHLGRDVVLVDLNLQFGAIDVLLDIQPERSIRNLLSVIDDLTLTQIENVLYRRSLDDQTDLLVLPAPLEPREADAFASEDVSAILIALKTYYDLIVVDTSSPISDITLSALELSDRILLVCTPDILSIRQLRAGSRFLESPEFRINRDAIQLVINCSKHDGAVRPQDIKQLFDYSVVGEIPRDDPTVQYSLSTGKTPVEIQGPNAIAEAVRDMAEGLKLIPAGRGKERATWARLAGLQCGRTRAEERQADD